MIGSPRFDRIAERRNHSPRPWTAYARIALLAVAIGWAVFVGVG